MNMQGHTTTVVHVPAVQISEIDVALGNCPQLAAVDGDTAIEKLLHLAW